jgi:hypothetical protein
MNCRIWISIAPALTIVIVLGCNQLNLADRVEPPPGEAVIRGICLLSHSPGVQLPDGAKFPQPEPEPQPNAQVTIRNQRSNKVIAKTRSGADGKFEVRVPPGSYEIAGRLDQEPPLFFSHATHVDVRTGQTVEVKLGLSISHP